MLPTVPLLRAGGVYNSLDVQDITPAQGGEVVAQITMSNSGLIKRDLLDLKKSRESLIYEIENFNWKNGFYRKDIGFKIIDK